LLSETSEVEGMATFLTQKYSQPAVRFQSLTFNDLLNGANIPRTLELGDVVRVKFTPQGIGTEIDQYAEVIGIEHEMDSISRSMVVNLDAIQTPSWRLNDLIFGRLSAGNALAY
jgi:hypothetical protein